MLVQVDNLFFLLRDLRLDFDFGGVGAIVLFLDRHRHRLVLFLVLLDAIARVGLAVVRVFQVGQLRLDVRLDQLDVAIAFEIDFLDRGESVHQRLVAAFLLRCHLIFRRLALGVRL